MDIDLKIINDWLEELRSQHENINNPNRVKISTVSYVGIKEDGSETPAMPSYWIFRKPDCKYGVVIAQYVYTVQTQNDCSFFVLFLSDDQQCEYLEKNGWKMYLDIPIVSQNRTHNRYCYIENNNKCLKIELNIFNDKLFTPPTFTPKNIQKCFTIFEYAQKCTKQEELDVLKKIFDGEYNPELLHTLFGK